MNSMTIPDEAVEAAGTAIYETLEDMRFHPVTDTARAALSAAMPHLHPTIPNTVKALEALPEGSVIQTAGTTLADTCVYTRWPGSKSRWAGAGSYAVPTTSELVAYAEAELGLPGWRVLWPMGGAS